MRNNLQKNLDFLIKEKPLSPSKEDAEEYYNQIAQYLVDESVTNSNVNEIVNDLRNISINNFISGKQLIEDLWRIGGETYLYYF
jgi:hypothetical protein